MSDMNNMSIERDDDDEGKHLQRVLFIQLISSYKKYFCKMNQLPTNTITNNASNDADHLASQLIILRMKKVDKAGQRSNKTPRREFVMHQKIFFVSIFP